MWVPYAEVKWTKQPEVAKDHHAFAEAEVHGNGSSWDKEMERPGYKELFYAYEHLLSNKESNFVSTKITQMDQHLESDRNRDFLIQEGRNEVWGLN